MILSTSVWHVLDLCWGIGCWSMKWAHPSYTACGKPAAAPWLHAFRYSVRVSPQMANRIVDSARSVINKFIPDIYIYTDHLKGANSGKWVSRTKQLTLQRWCLERLPGCTGTSVSNGVWWVPRSPGFGLVLAAETQKGFFLSAELSSAPQGQGPTILPEDLGKNCAKLLLEEIHRVGNTHTHTQTLFRLCLCFLALNDGLENQCWGHY